jgi:hypothetical protein
MPSLLPVRFQRGTDSMEWEMHVRNVVPLLRLILTGLRLAGNRRQFLTRVAGMNLVP